MINVRMIIVHTGQEHVVDIERYNVEGAGKIGRAIKDMVGSKMVSPYIWRHEIVLEFDALSPTISFYDMVSAAANTLLQGGIYPP